jgi:tetratricopeptide (TPR) repeat protein
LGLAGAVLVVGVLSTAGAVYWQQQRQRGRERAAAALAQAQAGLAQAVELRQNYRFADAQAMLKQVRGWGRHAADRGLQQRLEQAEADLALAHDLDRVRQEAATFVDGKWNPGRAREQYPEVLARHGLDVLEGDVEEVAQRIRVSAVREDLVAALDDWARHETAPQNIQWLLRLANRADEPDAWRQAVRQAVLRRDRKRLHQLASNTVKGMPTPGAVLLLAARFSWESPEPIELLQRMQLERPRDFWVSFTLGYRLHAQKKYQEAAECSLVAVALRPDSSAAQNNLGSALYGKGKMDDAVVCFTKATALNPKFAKAHSNLGNALSGKGKVDEAIACFQKAIALDPRFAMAHKNLGNALYGKGKVEEAIACYHKAIAIDPRYAVAHYNLGVALQGKGKVDEAIECHKRALALAPRFAMAHNNLGLALQGKGKVDEAITCYHKAIAIDPKLAAVHYNMGNILRDHKRDYDGAIACFQKAIALDPKLALAHNNLGNILRDHKRDYDGAIACFQKAIALNPKSAEAHTNLGLVLRRKGQLDEAIECHRKAIELAPKLAPAHNNLGNALADKGKVEEAIACFRKAIALNPKNTGAYNNLGKALAAKGQVEEAIACFRKAIALDPKFTKAHTDLGAALASKGKVEEAIACFRKAIALDPKNAIARCNLGQALADQGRFAESLAAFQRGHELGSKQPGWNYPSAQLVCQAERLAALESKLSAFLKGELKPSDTAECLGLIRVCHVKKLHHAEAVLYAAAFAADSKLGDDLKADHRYNAACCAALAAAGKGEDAGKLDDKERARLRKQALDWLKADLTALSKVLDSGSPRAQPFIVQILSHWQQDTDLAGIRDKAALDKLPAQEQKAFAQLWADVAALLQKAQTPAKKEEGGQAMNEAAVLEGKDRPKDAAECLGFAYTYQMDRHRFANAARFFAEAFAEQPALATNLQAGHRHRYDAACSAALAGCGKGDQGRWLPEQQRRAWRQQAPAWLRADLDGWCRLLEKDPDKVRPVIIKEMQHWLTDPDFSGVRGPQALANLPQEERPAW